MGMRRHGRGSDGGAKRPQSGALMARGGSGAVWRRGERWEAMQGSSPLAVLFVSGLRLHASPSKITRRPCPPSYRSAAAAEPGGDLAPDPEGGADPESSPFIQRTDGFK